jgi:hypothetical protein
MACQRGAQFCAPRVLSDRGTCQTDIEGKISLEGQAWVTRPDWRDDGSHTRWAPVEGGVSAHHATLKSHHRELLSKEAHCSISAEAAMGWAGSAELVFPEMGSAAPSSGDGNWPRSSPIMDDDSGLRGKAEGEQSQGSDDGRTRRGTPLMMPPGADIRQSALVLADARRGRA